MLGAAKGQIQFRLKRISLFFPSENLRPSTAIPELLLSQEAPLGLLLVSSSNRLGCIETTRILRGGHLTFLTSLM